MGLSSAWGSLPWLVTARVGDWSPSASPLWSLMSSFRMSRFRQISTVLAGSPSSSAISRVVFPLTMSCRICFSRRVSRLLGFAPSFSGSDCS